MMLPSVRITLTAALMATLALTPALAQPCTQPQPPKLEGSDGDFEGGVSISVGRIADLIWVPLLIDGQPPKPIKAGESYQIPAGAIHDGESGPKGAKVIATYVVEKGKPLATPAK